jgi:hypothetical protein
LGFTSSSASCSFFAVQPRYAALSASSQLFAARLGRLSSSHFFFHLNKKFGVFFTAVQHCRSV